MKVFALRMVKVATTPRWQPQLESSEKESALAVNLRCCIRAAADVAASPSAGVFGWNVGQLKAMWKGRKLPKWVADFFKGDIANADDETPIWL